MIELMKFDPVKTPQSSASVIQLYFKATDELQIDSCNSHLQGDQYNIILYIHVKLYCLLHIRPRRHMQRLKVFS